MAKKQKIVSNTCWLRRYFICQSLTSVVLLALIVFESMHLHMQGRTDTQQKRRIFMVAGRKESVIRMPTMTSSYSLDVQMIDRVSSAPCSPSFITRRKPSGYSSFLPTSWATYSIYTNSFVTFLSWIYWLGTHAFNASDEYSSVIQDGFTMVAVIKRR